MSRPMRWILLGILIFTPLLMVAAASPATEGTPYKIQPPLGLPEVPIPADNPMTAEKVELGAQLYFDKRLSADLSVSCASCHDPARGWADASRFSVGVKGLKGTRSSSSVLNTAYEPFQFWDGRAKTLEEQALGPIQAPVEMGETLDNVVKKLNAIPGYREQFQEVFGTDATPDAIAKAIAAFERTALSGDSAFDRYQKGDKKAMSDAAIRGHDLFKGKAGCIACHSGFNFSDGLFHNLGVGMLAKTPDLGRFKVTQQEKDRGAFKTMTLRDISKTAPYMHDGSEPTLDSVVSYYDRGGNKNPGLDPKIKPLGLTKEEKADLVAFLKALDGKPVEVKPPVLPK